MDEELLNAVVNNEIEKVKLLLENGANIHAKDDYALCESASRRHFEIVKLLLEHAIKQENTLVDQYNIMTKHPEVIELLNKKGGL
nr:MAG: hypothetical protein B6I27_02130 [Erwiniaceae bacterium 4572_131]